MVQGWAYDTNEIQLGDLLGLLGLQMPRCEPRAAGDQLYHPEERSCLRIKPAQRKSEQRELISMTLLVFLDPATPEADIHYMDQQITMSNPVGISFLSLATETLSH